MRFAQPSSPRGQTLVEFALVLPVLALLTVMSLDFGRVFFGWVALQNSARIAADRGATTADDWADSSDATVRSQYEQAVENDLRAINCSYPAIPDPTFTDANADGDNYGLGDKVSVTLTCSFDLLTPLAMDVLGGPVALSADAHFRIQKTIMPDVPPAPSLPPPCPAGQARVPYMIGETMRDARELWVFRDFQLSKFSPNVVGTNEAKIVRTQTTTPASNQGDCIADTASVLVTHDP